MVLFYRTFLTLQETDPELSARMVSSLEMIYIRISPKVDLTISPLLLKRLPDQRAYARKPHLSKFPGFTKVTDQHHKVLVRISSYPTKGPEETEEVT